jgi:hypothetical protein
MSKARRRAGRPALEAIETAVHLLRTAPAGVLLSYYLGSIPGVLGFVYFWADMSRGAFARERLIEAAFSAAALYVWMKCWQAVFASKLRAHLLLAPEAPWTVARVVRLAAVQIAVQPTGLFVRLLAAQVIIPYVWIYSFYQNVGVLGDGTRAGIREVVQEAAKQAGLWLRQTHLALACLFGFALFVWINVCILVGLMPAMLKTFFGLETVFARNPWAMVNTTTFAATLAATYLCFDPIRKALFVLRCFHGASLQSGEDLRVELKTIRRPVRALAAALLVLLVSPLPSSGAVEPPPTRVESAQLNDSLDRVLQRREYAWRLPREIAAQADEQKGWFTTFFEELWKRLARMMKLAVKWIRQTIDWLREAFDRPPKDHEASDRGKFDWLHTARWTLYVLIGVMAVALGVLLWRWHKGRKIEIATALPVVAVPDLNEENVTADQLPEDGWLNLARELVDKGELRLALRAFYLAGLAHLGRRELINIARHKSNLDYDRELQRRARGNHSLLQAFDMNLRAFERGWYGEHAVTPETLGGFSQNLEKIRTC